MIQLRNVSIGDLVIIHESSIDWNERMSEYIGQIRKVSEIKLDNKGIYVNFEDDANDLINCWYWRPRIHFSKYVRKTKKIKFKLKF